MVVELGEELLLDGGEVRVVGLLAQHAIVVVGLLHFLLERGALLEFIRELRVAYHLTINYYYKNMIIYQRKGCYKCVYSNDLLHRHNRSQALVYLSLHL